MIRCIAVDDEPLALELLETYCSKVPFLQLERVFTNASDAQKHLRKFPVDLLFLDIQMPDISGIDFYKSLSQNTMVVFTTAYTEYAVEGFNLSAIDYLLKPFEFSRFEQAVKKAEDYLDYLNSSKNNKRQYLFVRSEYKLVKISFDDILYIETLDDFLKIHVNNQKPVVTLSNLKEMLEKLPVQQFARVHRSFIVSLRHINFIRNKTVYIGSVEIPIGVTFETDFIRLYKS